MCTVQLKLCSVILVATALSACGGGGGGGGASLNLPLTVATGAPVQGASVQVTDGTGTTESCAGTTDASGVINCRLSTATVAPLLVKAERSGAALYAVIPSTEVPRANVTPISSAMARKFAANAETTVESLVANPTSMAATTAAQADAAVSVINSIVQIVASQTAQITVTNALTQPYSAVTTDNLDKLIHSVRFGGDNAGLTVSIPTATGTVAVSVAFTATASAAQTAVRSSTSNVTADLTDGDRITQTLSAFVSLLGSCSAPDQATMVSLFDAYSYSGSVKLNSGRTLSGWVESFCERNIGDLSVKMAETVARFDNVAIVRAVVENSSAQSFNIFVGMKKVSNDWKLLSDNLPFDSSWKTRHALSAEINSAGRKSVEYRRYLDMWIDDEAERTYDALLPAKIEAYMVALRDVNGYSTGNWSTLMASAPKMTFVRDINECGTRGYRLESSSGCNSFISDSSIPNVFDLLKTNDFTVAIVRLLDANGACLNCNADASKGNYPESLLPLGRAYDFNEIFGTTVTESALQSGVELGSLSSGFWAQVKKRYATPSANVVDTFLTTIGGASIGSSIDVTWESPALAPNRQIDGTWGGFHECGLGSTWRNFNEIDSVNLTENRATFRHPSAGGDMARSSYLSFTIASRFTESEFAFYMNANKPCS